MIERISLTRSVYRAVSRRVHAYLELSRPRIAILVLMATLLGFTLASSPFGGLTEIALLVHTLVGTAMIAAGANALNQYIEADFDCRMVRTMSRPIPSGRLSKREALTFGAIIGVTGVMYLTVQANHLAGLLGGITLASYVLVYTPLKRAHWYSVFVGAVPGALPPVIGWAGATGALAENAWLLFSIVYFWQLPHFAAIAWLHRQDYGRAGYPMLSVIDASGKRIGRHMLIFSFVLLVVSLLPTLQGMAGVVYGIGAAVLGVAFLGCAVRFVLLKSSEAARFHLFASIVYLPALITLMLVSREV